MKSSGVRAGLFNGNYSPKISKIFWALYGVALVLVSRLSQPHRPANRNFVVAEFQRQRARWNLLRIAAQLQISEERKIADLQLSCEEKKLAAGRRLASDYRLQSI